MFLPHYYFLGRKDGWFLSFKCQVFLAVLCDKLMSLQTYQISSDKILNRLILTRGNSIWVNQITIRRETRLKHFPQKGKKLFQLHIPVKNL